MAKDTNMSRCLEVDRDSDRRISSIRSDRFRTNDGFMFKISVVHSGRELTTDQISHISVACTTLVRSLFNRYYSESDSGQLEFDFGLC